MDFWDNTDPPTVDECLRKARKWARVPWSFFVQEWLRLAKETGPLPTGAEEEILAILARHSKN